VGLEIEEDPDHEQREWLLQRIGWALVGGLLLAGMLGLFGGGPLTHATLRHPQAGLQVSYDRYIRRNASTSLRVIVEPEADGRTARFWISRSYLEHFNVASVMLEPERTEHSQDRVIFHVPMQQPSLAASVTFQMEADEIGRVEGRIGTSGGRSLPIEQVVYP
jgi:hypothetical protein